MNRILFVYDNTVTPNENLQSIIGKRKFGEIIFKRMSLQQRCMELVKALDGIEIIELNSLEQLHSFQQQLERGESTSHTAVLHFFANSVCEDNESFTTLVNKAKYIRENYQVQVPSTALLLFHNIECYCQYLRHCRTSRRTNDVPESIHFERLQSTALIDISEPRTFLRFISGAFDVRFFNQLTGDDHIVTKSSSDIQKIQSEYHYYTMLPDAMKMWFVLPFNYSETATAASYSMERYQLADIATMWVHGAFDLAEFERLLDKVFFFINSRCTKNVSLTDYEAIASELYLNKVQERIQKLTKHSNFHAIAQLIATGTSYASLEAIFADYASCYRRIFNAIEFEAISVIGHGDLCFSNMLYSKEASLLRLIDPKGAMEEKDLWTNPYYDLAKLSHSICGRYDFFNSGLFDIHLGSNLQFELVIEFDNSQYTSIFRRYLKNHGFDYSSVRLFEASLFLSMLPLHADYPRKVFGFILNAIQILHEVKLCLRT